MCGWSSTESKGYQWQRGRGIDEVANTPMIDHTYSDLKGHFAYLHHGDKAEDAVEIYLTSPDQMMYDVCLEFFYYMEGPPAWQGVLNLYILYIGESMDQASLIWSQTGDKNYEWNYAALHVETGSKYQVIFQVTFLHVPNTSVPYYLSQ